MLKITLTIDDQVATFKLEGKLTGEWVNELRTCWQQVLLTGKQTSIRVDLAGVSWVSDEGTALLGAMRRDGAELSAANLLMAGIVAELALAPGDRNAASPAR